MIIIQNADIVVQEMQLELLVVKTELQSKWAVCLCNLMEAIVIIR